MSHTLQNLALKPVERSSCGVHSMGFPGGSRPANSIGHDFEGRTPSKLEAMEDSVSLPLEENMPSDVKQKSIFHRFSQLEFVLCCAEGGA